ncbi:hypothetical protein [Chamaesiphon sp. GL140_3_metabinner_50]|nr:hypothetical protein [Chamaesiphon sp. GL140_3_metabinner_50]
MIVTIVAESCEHFKCDRSHRISLFDVWHDDRKNRQLPFGTDKIG